MLIFRVSFGSIFMYFRGLLFIIIFLVPLLMRTPLSLITAKKGKRANTISDFWQNLRIKLLWVQRHSEIFWSWERNL